MKRLLHTLIAVAAFLIQTTCVQGQYTYETAVRVASYSTSITPDSNQILQPGIGTGCATVTTQPLWMWLGHCGTGNMNL